jgi:hypothetical protein
VAVTDQGEKSSSPRADPQVHRTVSILRIDREGKRGRNLFFQLQRNHGVAKMCGKPSAARTVPAHDL